MTDEELFLESNPEITKILPTDTKFPQKIFLARTKKPKPIFHLGNFIPLHGGVSVVGTRNCSNEGAFFAETVGRVLAENNITVNSGLARGIDSFAHKGCIENDGVSVAILAWFHKLYPPENRTLLEEILVKGCAISETLLMPKKFAQSQFIERDKIMAIISDAIIVVESKSKGGAKFTAEYAKKKNIPVIKCRTDTDDEDLIEGHKTFLDNGALEATSPDDVIRIISELEKNNNVQLNTTTLDTFLDL